MALAAMAIAGCGGGSDNGSSGGSVTDTETLRAGLAFTLPSGGVTIRNGQSRTFFQRAIKCDGPKDCELTVTGSVADGYQLTSTGGTITVTLVSPPPQQDNQQNNQLQQNNNQLTQDNNQLRQNNMQLQQALNNQKQQGNIRVRVPLLLAGLQATFDGSPQFGDDNVTVEHMRGKSPNIKVPGYTSTTPRTIPNWNSSRYTFDGSDDKITVSLYTNIGSPGTREFWKVHGTAALQVTGITAGGDAKDNNPKIGDDPLQVTIGIPVPVGSDNLKRISSNGEDFNRLTVNANFGGTPGKLICSNCTGVVGSSDDAQKPTHYFGRTTDGRPDFKNGAWDTFEADRPIAPHQRPQDETYLYFGMWAQNPEDEIDPYGTNNFRSIEGPEERELSSTDTNGLEGEATFVGGAVGEYAIGELGQEGQVGYRKAKAGSFTATANLTANFVGNGDDTLQGNITGFQENGSPLGWGTLRLVGTGETALNTPGSKATLTATVEGGAVAGDMRIEGTEVEGNWGATLYGVANNATAAADPPQGARCQDTGCAAELAGVAGWFHASGGIVSGGGDTDVDAAIVGAFGAAYTGQ